eukprot:1136454-Pelagomonas_calceolata.AAC.2
MVRVGAHLCWEHVKNTCLLEGSCPALEKGDTLAQKSLESPPPRRLQKEGSNGDLKGYWKHPAP